MKVREAQELGFLSRDVTGKSHFQINREYMQMCGGNDVVAAAVLGVYVFKSHVEARDDDAACLDLSDELIADVELFGAWQRKTVSKAKDRLVALRLLVEHPRKGARGVRRYYLNRSLLRDRIEGLSGDSENPSVGPKRPTDEHKSHGRKVPSENPSVGPKRPTDVVKNAQLLYRK